MYAIEFESQINDGILKIPKHYKEMMQSDKAKVIIMVELKNPKVKPSKSTDNSFLEFLENGPTISKKESKNWEEDIRNGYKSWTIEQF